MTAIPDRHLSLFDGRDRIGSMIARPGAVDAFSVDGVHLGSFKTVAAASAAINCSVSLRSCVPDSSGRMDGSSRDLDQGER